MLEKTPDVKDLFINSQRGTNIIPFILFKTLRYVISHILWVVIIFLPTINDEGLVSILYCLSLAIEIYYFVVIFSLGFV